ncbi:MAG: hypothetical protein EA405_14135 [Rhodospirillales bacterium]|nr:MAG: hypothetical protein EA405_14135 [Rhodospirillales bacterium]
MPRSPPRRPVGRGAERRPPRAGAGSAGGPPRRSPTPLSRSARRHRPALARLENLLQQPDAVDGGGNARAGRQLDHAFHQHGARQAEVGAVDDYPDTTATSGVVPVGGATTGTIEIAGDRDWFAVTLVAGERYQIDLEGAPTSSGTLGDPFLRGLYDATGTLLPGTADDDGGVGLNSRLEYAATVSGTHYISAGAFGDHTGTYKLAVSAISAAPADDYPDTTATSGVVPVGGATTGTIEIAGDRDWFAVTLVAGERYQIDLEGAPTGSGTLGDPFLRGLYDATGTLLPGTADDDGGTDLNSRLEYTAATSGTHYPTWTVVEGLGSVVFRQGADLIEYVGRGLGGGAMA